eukprot:1169762-Heterocapsa_arctica.AAC.1
MVTEHSVEVQAQAKNATIKRNGGTPGQAAFGHSLRWMSTVLNDDDDLHLSALDTKGATRCSTLMRATACKALHNL